MTKCKRYIKLIRGFVMDTETLRMTAIVKDEPKEGFSIKKKTISTGLQQGEVLIKVQTASFCGTDYHLYAYDDWARQKLDLPLIVGHEFSGEVLKVADDVEGVRVGDIVSAETHIICGECEFCLRGEGHICENTEIIGVDTDGSFAGYVKIPAMNCFVNDENADPRHLSVQEPLGNAVHTMAHFPVKDRTVAIVGCGPLGLMGIDVAKAYGAKKIIGIEINPRRKAMAADLGADVVIDPKEEDVIERVLSETDGRGVDVVGEFSGNKSAIQQAFKYVKPGGGMSLLGIPAENIEVNLADDVVFKGIEIYGVVGRRIYDTWHEVRRLIDEGLLHLDKIITHTLPLKEANKAAEIMGSGDSGKILLTPEEDDYA